MNTHRTTLIVIAVVGAALIVGGLGALLSNDEPAKPPGTITTKVDTLDGSPDRDKTITIPKAAVDQAAAALSGDVSDVPLDAADADHTGQRGETPDGTVAPVLDANRRALAANRRTTTALSTAGASGGFPGCRTAFVRNQSTRRGTRPTVQVLHYTVSPNRPGRSDVDGITAYFNRSSTQASSHFVIDAEGNCNYIVPIEAKAWTQGGGNPWAVSYEIIATGREREYLEAAGYAKLRAVMREVSRRTSIPLRAGRISGCAPARSGIVQHANGGTCWGGHHDVGPFPFSAIVAKVTGGGDRRAARARDLRSRHAATHGELERRACAPSDRTRSDRCKLLHRRHRALHRAASAAGVKFA